MTSTLQM